MYNNNSDQSDDNIDDSDNVRVTCENKKGGEKGIE